MKLVFRNIHLGDKTKEKWKVAAVKVGWDGGYLAGRERRWLRGSI